MDYISNSRSDFENEFPLLELLKKEILMAYISSSRSGIGIKISFLVIPKKENLMDYIVTMGEFLE